MPYHPWYNRKGEPVSMEEGARLLSDIKERMVARTELPDGRVVSTVFLVLDHGHVRKGPPVLFETMVFNGDNSEDSWRYCFESEALESHATIVKELEMEIERKKVDTGPTARVLRAPWGWRRTSKGK